MNPAGSGLRSSDARFADLTEDNGYIKVVKFAGSFYAAVDLAINRLCLTYNSGYLEICPHSLLIEDKISRLRLMWNGAFFQRMEVYVDLAPAVESDQKLDEPTPLGVKPCKTCLIPKASRHDEARLDTYFHVSHCSTEQAVIAALPLNVKHGLILAKAARIASIARPAEDLTSHYGLQEDIHGNT